MSSYQEREEERRQRGQLNFRAGLDISMGVLYLVIPAFAAAMPGLQEEYGKSTVYIISGLFGLYGLVRIGRGYYAMRQIFKRKERTSRPRS